MAKRTNKNIILGSGEIFLKEYNSNQPMPTVADICTEQYRLGYIKGGATLSYSETTYEEKDDLGYVRKIITTEEEAKFKLGLITWNGVVLTRLIDRGTTEEAEGIRITRLGGAGNAQDKNYVLCFHHTDQKDGDIWVLLVGRNTAGLSLAWSTGAGTQVEPEFTAMPHDEDGTLIQYIEQVSDITPVITLTNSAVDLTVGGESDLAVTITPAAVAALCENKVTWTASAGSADKIVLGGGHTTECHVRAVGTGSAAVTASIVYAGKTYSAVCEIHITSAT